MTSEGKKLIDKKGESQIVAFGFGLTFGTDLSVKIKVSTKGQTDNFFNRVTSEEQRN